MRVFDPSSIFTKAVVAASYLGIPYTTLMHGESGTLCLNEYRRKHGGRVIYFTAQVMAHAARVAIGRKCDGRCKQVAEKVIEQARATLETGR
jgi:hypothetical protein